jgi:putative endonuclease
VGKHGENLAERFLKKKRYKIVERNYREKWGEIDIIALSPDKTLVFVEVKTVTGPESYVEPEEHLTRTKLERLQRTAELYANSANNMISDNGWRVDLVAIILEGDTAKVRHYENI